MSGHGSGGGIPRGAKRFIALLQQYNKDFAHFLPNDIGTRDEIRLTSTTKLVGEKYEVQKVVDGDTLTILYNNVPTKVRLIGINTPETVDPRRPVECFGKEASDRMKSLAGGKSVYLETDDTQGVYDKYGRLLAYVYTEDGQMLNRKMIAEGYAYEYTYLHPYRYQKEFKEYQAFAKNSKQGLWADSACGTEALHH
jgi:micrococcal nuclease